MPAIIHVPVLPTPYGLLIAKPPAPTKSSCLLAVHSPFPNLVTLHLYSVFLPRVCLWYTEQPALIHGTPGGIYSYSYMDLESPLAPIAFLRVIRHLADPNSVTCHRPAPLFPSFFYSRSSLSRTSTQPHPIFVYDNLVPTITLRSFAL